MALKNRLQKLEKQVKQRPNHDPLLPRVINYRAGLIEGIPDAPDSIPLKVVIYDADKGQPNEATT